MAKQRARAFRPEAEGVEGRCLATGGGVAAAAVPAVHAQVWNGHMASQAALRRVFTHGPHALAGGPTIGPGLGGGLLRLGLPQNFQDWGVVTLWNNTKGPVSFAVSASTFANGQYFGFTLRSGQVMSFYAPATYNLMPVFRVALNPGQTPYTLPRANLVFEARTYLPAGTAGYPYAINTSLNGFGLSYI